GQAQRIAGGKATALAVGSPVFAGDVLETQRRTRLEVKLADQSVLRLGPVARVDLTAASFGRSVEERQVSAKLKVGSVWAKVAKTVGGEARFEVKTENAVAGVRGTTFRVDAAKDRSVVVKVYTGTVAVVGSHVPRPMHGEGGDAEPGREPEPKKVAAAGGEGKAGAEPARKGRKQIAGPKQVTKEQWEKIVTSMMAVSVSADGTASEPASFAVAGQGQDDWESWNRERDAVE
ncbi:MAG: FecR family protein, partial [Anaeromyxobacteraceae bacterium]